MKRSPGVSVIYLLLLIGFYLPVVYVFYQIFQLEAPLSALISVVKSQVFLKTLYFSLTEAVLSAVLSIVLALPGAYFMGRFNFFGKKWWRSLLILPFMMPGIILVLAIVIFYGQNGLFNQILAQLSSEKIRFTGLYGFGGIVLAHVLYNLPFCLRMLGESWEGIDPALREASANLGARTWFTWTRLTLPLILPTIGYLFLIVFLYSFLSFTVVMVFGGYLYKTFEVLIYIEYNSKLHFEQAAIIAGLQTIVLLMFFWVQTLFHQKIGNRQTKKPALPNLNLRDNPWQSCLFGLYQLGLGIFLMMPFLALLSRSFYRRSVIANGFSLENYRLLFSPAFKFNVGNSFPQVLSNSILIALGVTLITVTFAYLIARQRRAKAWGLIDLLFQLPLGISFMSFGFGLGTLLGQILPRWVLIIWAQVFMAFPLVYSILRTAWHDFDGTLLESASMLGALPSQLFCTIELPLMGRAIQTSIAYALAISLSDLSAVLLLGKGSVVTLTMAIYRLIGHYHFPQALALGCIFMGITLLIFMTIEWGGKTKWLKGREIR